MLDITIKREVASSYGILPYTIGHTRSTTPSASASSRTIYTTLRSTMSSWRSNPKFQYGPRSASTDHLCQIIERAAGADITLVDSVVKVSLPLRDSTIRE